MTKLLLTWYNFRSTCLFQTVRSHAIPWRQLTCQALVINHILAIFCVNTVVSFAVAVASPHESWQWSRHLCTEFNCNFSLFNTFLVMVMGSFISLHRFAFTHPHSSVDCNVIPLVCDMLTTALKSLSIPCKLVRNLPIHYFTMFHQVYALAYHLLI